MRTGPAVSDLGRKAGGMLAEKGSGLGGPWSDHLEGPVWELRVRLHEVAVRITYWCRPDGMIVFHTRWVRSEADAGDPDRIAIREALAFGKAVHDRRVALGLSVADLALRADMTADEIECIEEGGTEPTIALLRRLAAALDADVRLTPGHDLGLPLVRWGGVAGSVGVGRRCGSRRPVWW
jgi:DNA-binding XRE family transcriptional regulator